MPKRVDANQKEIVKVLRQLGFSVFITSDIGKGFTDAVAGIHKKNYLIEIKDGNKPPSGQKLTPAEQEFHESWKGQIIVINSVDQALEFYKSVTQSNRLNL